MKPIFINATLLSGFLLLLGPVLVRQTVSLAAENRIPIQSPQTSGKKGPHGGQIVSEKGKKFEIKLDQQTDQLDVYTTDPFATPPPKEIGITLYKSDKTGRTIRLKTVEPPRPGSTQYHYHGDFDPTEAPYVAFGLQFDLSPTPPEPGTQPEDK